MHLPAPTFAATIPSIYDGSKLEYRIYIPDQLESTTTSPRPIKGAIVAHPYASLGGSFYDPVVSFLGGELLKAGHVVGTFNFRYGAGESEGGTSWTAKPELGDYTSFYGFMLQYLHQLQVMTQGRIDSLEPALNQIQGQDRDQGSRAKENYGIRLILGGYSYGSFIASHLPTLDVIAELFQPRTGVTSSPTPFEKISAEARRIAALSIRATQPRENRTDDQGICVSTAISYLLMSPLLPPLTQVLTAFSTLSLQIGGTSAQTRPAGCPADQLRTHKTFALYGDKDTFNSVRKLRDWSSELGRMPQSLFQSCEIKGAGHFWREDGVEERAKQGLREWLQQV
ncbi:hypothetical protein N7495_006856 [Penicillium taxi]|uniref:uncharacterized protein n=1 Tax=Penicillium taxi TaxID=168475 RepID=UPI002545626F|nr:uncharacterized protein N7495_006856 [Penicillium taxi]KAJ5895165.1 hypothetical protein N7495_006856 [Penicillium taxi]